MPDSAQPLRRRLPSPRFAVAVACLLSALTVGPLRAYDDCDSKFIAYLGADAYQFSPAHSGELGRVRLFSVLSNQRAAAFGDYGTAYWRLEIRDELGRVVRAADGAAKIDPSGQALAEFFWNGRDDSGRQVAPGRYAFSFLGRFLADRERGKIARPISSYSELAGVGIENEAYASTDYVIVNDQLEEKDAASLRQSLAAGACQMRQNTPIEAGFGYNYYYGSTHSHSNWSDGGQPTTACSSGNGYGSGTFTPAQVYDFARNSAGLDYWVINEHNHLINDALATNAPPVTEAKVKQRYADGRAAAVTATVNDVFVALYGMEWGVTTNADQGHVTLLETPKLFGWETCSTCNGPNAECTVGSNCYFDIFTPKRFGYLTMYKRSVENPSPAGALGIFCHPGTGEFDNFAFNADADQAMQGIAVRSGLAFATATNCADANVASTDYSARWREALNKGFHLGPVADHDAHCNNYGVGLPNRTVYLLPNGTAPVLTRLAMLQAHKARHFYATEDSNAQLVFATADSSHVMGDIWNAAGGASLRAAVYDPDNEGVSTLEIWRGQIGGGVPASAYRTVSNTSTISLTENLSSGTYYYYVHAVQADGHDLWSSPMWISYGAGGCTSGCTLDLSGWHLVQANSAATFTLPAGSTIAKNGYLIVARDATKSAFETFWRGGAALPAGVTYVNSAGVLPLINGSETYRLTNVAGTTIDGTTVAMPASANSTLMRKDPCLAANLASSWTTASASSATPGTGAAAGCAKGMVINEFADALGTNNFVYEYVELHWDQ